MNADSKRCDRRRMMSVCAGVGAGWLFGSRQVLAGVTGYEPEPHELVTPEANRAIALGLGYLASRQNMDGSFGSGGYSQYVGICGLAGMAFLSSGSAPGCGPFGVELERCVEFILSHVQDNGLISAEDGASHGPMYGHGFATLFLAEVYGLAPHQELRDKLTQAVQLIVDTQNEEGGWRYQARRSDADLTVTICQMMALRAAKNAGIHVPSETTQRCLSFVKRCQNADGGFMYLPSGGPSAFPRSAAGVVGLFSAGIHKGKSIEKGLDYLTQFTPATTRREDESHHFFYGHYYAVQAMWHSGGERWAKWYPAIRDLLVSRQTEEGAWRSALGNEYGTAMSTIILQMPNSYLPMFQQ